MTAREKRERLDAIYCGVTAEDDGAFLSACLRQESDYLLRSKAFLTAEKVGGKAVAVAAAVVEDVAEERQWQLRGLSVLDHHPAAAPLSTLSYCLFQREKPLLIRGGFWVLCGCAGEEAASTLASFLVSPFVGYLKADFVTAALRRFAASPVNRRLWAEKAAADPALAGFAAALEAEGGENDLLMVYPYPDYLSRCAEQRGYTPKEWKSACFFPRKKKAAQRGRP